MATHQSSPSPRLETGQPKDHDDSFQLEYTKTLEQVRSLFNQMDDRFPLIDTIQRLALDHHFADDIRAVLQQHYATFCSKTCEISSDLYDVSLSFRLLRQAGFDVNQDVFTRFMDEKGKFNNNLSEDTKGLLALYETSHVGVEGDNILDEAMEFSSRLLRANLPQNTCDDNPQSKMIKYSLQNSQNKSNATLNAKKFLQVFVCEKEWEFVLKDIAKMELIVARSLIEEEVLRLGKWLDGLGISRELKCVRNQPKKWQMWSMTVLPHPSWSLQRIMLTKPISLVYIVDDIFDLYGTLDQLTIFTQAVKRWEIDETEAELPEYMKMCLQAIQDTTHEITRIVYQEHGCNPLHILKRSWGSLFDAFLKEAEWFASGELPKADEYLKNGIMSSGVPMVLTHLFYIMGIGFTKEAQDQLLNDTIDSNCILHSVAMILRLVDDLGSAKDENQDGYDGSYVECYMKEHNISSYEIVKKHVMRMVSDTWKKLNEECLISSSPFPPSFNKACLNAARMVPTMYNYEDNHAQTLLGE